MFSLNSSHLFFLILCISTSYPFVFMFPISIPTVSAVSISTLLLLMHVRYRCSLLSTSVVFWFTMLQNVHLLLTSTPSEFFLYLESCSLYLYLLFTFKSEKFWSLVESNPFFQNLKAFSRRPLCSPSSSIFHLSFMVSHGLISTHYFFVSCASFLY